MGFAALLVLIAVAVPGVARSSPDDFVSGSGSASGSVARFRLFYGGLSLPMAIGTTSTSYTNAQSKALGVALDLGGYVSLVGDVPPEFAPTVIDSNDGDTRAQGTLEAGNAIARVELSATQTPRSSAELRVADFDLPGMVRVEGAHSRSRSGIRNGESRSAAAVVEVARVSIADLVILEGLRWEASHQSGVDPSSSGSFTVGNLRVAGIGIPIPASGLDDAIGVVNTVLAAVGLRIDLPTATTTPEGSVSVSPLSVSIADSPLGSELLAPIIASTQPLLGPVLEATTELNSTLGLVSLVADLVLGVADGSGGLEAMVGGVSASTSDVGFVPRDSPTSPTPSGDTAASSPAPPTTPRVTTRADRAVPASAEVDLAAAEPPSIDAPVIASASTFRCVLEAAPRRGGSCRGSNLPVAFAISALAVSGVACAEYSVRQRRRAKGRAIEGSKT